MSIIVNASSIIMLSFFLQIAFGALLFAGDYRKKNSIYHIILVGILMLGISTCFMIIAYGFSSNILISSAYYIVSFGLVYVFFQYSFSESWEELLMCTLSGYLVQHIVAQFIQIFLRFNGFDARESQPMELLLFSLSQFIIYAIFYTIIYFSFARKTKKMNQTSGVRKKLILLTFATFVIILLLSSVRDAYAYESFILNIISRFFSVICCFFVFVLRYYVIEHQEQETERQLLEQMNEMQMKQYKLSSETIDLINQKCHDMRHQIQLWEKQGGADVSELDDMRRLISIYDTSVKTGNDVLDTILTEKSIFCEHNGINLSCIMDGRSIDFMKQSDICTLFGNALENAIEAVSKIDNRDDRIISMHLFCKQNMVVFTCENNYNGIIDIREGQIKTSKGDEAYHGFGVRSIRRVATSYGGEAIIEIDDMFRISVVIPVPVSLAD